MISALVSRFAILLASCLGVVCMPGVVHARDLDEVFEAADGEIEGYGGSYLMGISAVYSHHTRFDEDRADGEPPGNTYGILFEGSVMPFRTIFEAEGGVEASVGLGFPGLGAFFGGFTGSLGIMIKPVLLGPLKLSLGSGGAFGGHRYVYLKPRALLDFRGVALEASYTWNPAKGSRVWDHGGPPGETYGISEQKLRGQLWFRLSGFDGDGGDLTITGVHVFVEQTRVSTPAPEILEQKKIVDGTYWSGGVGGSF